MACEKTQFEDEIKVKILSELPPCSNCGGTQEVIAVALVRYNGEYCHIGSAEFTAKPTGTAPCNDEEPSTETPPDEPDPETPPDEENPPEDDPDEEQPPEEPPTSPPATLPPAPDLTIAPFTPLPPPHVRLINVNSLATLQAALDAALPGDWIVLADGVYAGGITIRKSGTSDHPIVISGTRNAILDGSGGFYGVNIGNSQYVRLYGFTVRDFFYGINSEAVGNCKNCLFDYLEIHQIGQEAIMFKGQSSDNTVQRCLIYDTGNSNPIFGEGIYNGLHSSPDGCHRNKFLGNDITTTAEAIDIKVGSQDVLVQANTIRATDIIFSSGNVDSLVAIGGTDCRFINNTLVPFAGWTKSGFHVIAGTHSYFSGNISTGFTHDPGQYGIRIDNNNNHIVECNNQGTTNKTCGPEIIVDPPPPLPTPYPQHRYAFGMWYGTSGSGRIGTEPCRDGVINAGNDMLLKLNQAKASNYAIVLRLPPNNSCRNVVGDPELNPSHALYDPTAVVDGYCLRKAKASVASSVNRCPNINSFVAEGVLRAILLFDDAVPSAAAHWNGRPPTGNEADELARYTKSFSGWATCPVAFRGPTSGMQQMKSVWNHMDIAWVQVKTNQWGTNRSRIKPEIIAEIDRAKAMGMSFMGIGNLLNQGSGLDGWTLNEDGPTSSLVGCSPTDIRKLGEVLAEIGDFKTLGAFFWGDTNFHPTYFLRADIQAALADMRDMVRNIKIGPPNWRDFD